MNFDAIHGYAEVEPPRGWLFHHVTAPVTTHVRATPCGPATKSVAESKTSFFWDFVFTGLSFAWDDATIEKIAREGGIEQVSFVDYQVLSIFGVFKQMTVRVHGV